MYNVWGKNVTSIKYQVSSTKYQDDLIKIGFFRKLALCKLLG